MRNVHLLLCLSVVLVLAGVHAVAPDINITQIDGNPDNDGSALPPFSYVNDGNLTVTFTVIDLDNDNLSFSMAYSPTQGEMTNPIVTYLGLTGDYCSLVGDWTTTTQCTYDFNIHDSLASDGNYFINVDLVDDTLPLATDSNSSSSFMIDNTAPTTSVDSCIVGGGSPGACDFSQWYAAIIVNLECDDGTGSGCGTTSPGAQVTVIADGNNAINFFSTDQVGNTESSKTAYVLIDTVGPAVTITTPADGNAAVTSTKVIFDVNRVAGSPVDGVTIAVKLNGIESASFSTANCTESDGNYHCEYTEAGLASNTYYDLNVFARDSVGNFGKKIITFDTNVVDSAPAAPTGLGATKGDGQVSLSWSANSEPDLDKYRIYRKESTDDFSTATSITTTTSTSYTDTGLSNDTTYYYWVTAVDTAGNESAPSSSAPATPEAAAGPSNCGSVAHGSCVLENMVPKYCDSGTLTASCSLCGSVCPSGSTCESNECKTTTTTDKCSDDTVIGECSGTKPKFCNNEKELVNDCETCSCPAGKSCVSDTGECVTTTGCAVDVTLLINGDSGPDYITAGTLSVGVSASGGKIYDTLLKVYVAGEGYRPTLDSGNAVYDLEGTATIDEEDERVLVEFVGTDADGSACGIRHWVDVDAVLPGVELDAPSADEKLKGKVTLKASASDAGSGIKSVNFYFQQGTGDWQHITGMSARSSGVYEYVWDTDAKAENGDCNVKVEAKDKAGNVAVEEVAVVVSNEPTPEELAEFAQEWADANKDVAIAFLDSLSSIYFVLPLALKEKKELAGQKLADAEALIEQGDYNAARELAAAAAGLYAELKGAVSAKPYAEKSLELDEDEFGQGLAASGLDAELVDDALEMLEESTVSRRMVVVEVTEDGETYYQANIVLKYRNDSGEAKDVQLVEVIPKSFALWAGDITSGREFTVLVEDPVIQFDVGLLGVDADIEVVYGLKKELTKVEADALTAGGVASGFLTPLIVLGSDVSLSSESFAAMFDLSWLFGNIMLLLGIVVVVLLAIIAAVIYRGGGLGETGFGSNGEYGMQQAMRDTEPNPLRKAANWFGGLGKPSAGSRPSRFAWKG